MRYSVVLTDQVLKQLRKMDKHVATMLLSWIERNLDGTTQPRALGKPLVGNHKNKWRYRVGMYRILAHIQDDTLIILVLTAAHRKKAYH